MRAYDPTALTLELASVSTRGRSAFACSCAERSIRPFVAYLQETAPDQIALVRTSLDATWLSAIGDVPIAWSREKTRAILGLVPQTPIDSIFELWTSAENAAAVIVYAAWSRRSHRIENAVSAAGRSYEMYFYAAEDFLGHQPLDVLNSSDLVQLELTRQEEDFLALQQADVPQTYMNLKAQSESIDVLSEFKNGKGPCYFR